MDEKAMNELYELAIKTKPNTFLSVIGHPHSENLLSDCLAFMLNKDKNGIGVSPLNILLQCVNSHYKVDESDKVTIKREYCFDKGNRIDILIYVEPQDKRKPFYIGIENKILSAEGDKQTSRYANYLFADTQYTKGEKNIGIFLTQCGENAESPDFNNITYHDLLDGFESIESDNVYFKDFKAHIETYISPNAFSAEDLDFISFFDSKSFKKRQTLEAIKDYITNNLDIDNPPLVDQIFEYTCILRNIFFNIVERVLNEFLSSIGEYIIEKKNKQSFYIQFYKENWESEGIHFEIIIPYNKGILVPNEYFFIMLHKEKGTRTSKDKFRDNFRFRKETSNFNKKNNVLYEISCPIREFLSEDIVIKDKIKDMLDKLKIEEKAKFIDDYINNTTK